MDINTLINGLGDVADLINSGSDTETTLRQLIIAACRNGNWLRGSIMSVDLTSGFAYVTVRHDPTLQIARFEDQWVLATSPSLVALRSNEPVFIPNAQTSDEFPGFQKESRLRGYCSVLVMPMRGTDLLGRPMVLTVNSEKVKELGPTDLALMKLIVHLGSIAVEKQKTIAEQKASARAREIVLSTHTHLMQQAISDDSVQRLCDTIYPIILRPALVVDLTTNTIVPGAPPTSHFVDETTWQDVVETQLRPLIQKLPFDSMRQDRQQSGATLTEFHVALPNQSFDLPASVYPLRIDGEIVGAFILFGDDEQSEYDHLLIGSVRLAISVQLMRNLIRFHFERRTLDDLFAEMVDGKWQDESDLTQRALKFGIRLNRTYRMIVISFSGGENFAGAAFSNVQKGLALFFDRDATSSLIIGCSDCIVILVPVGKNATGANLNDLMRKLLHDIRHYSTAEPTLVLSAPCSSLQDYPRHWKSCKTILKIAQSVNKTGILLSEQLGPLPILLSTADIGYVDEFVRHSVGAILEYDKDNQSQFFLTLKAYIDSGYRYQPCADHLGIHVTTLRYRITKLSELFDLDLDTPGRRFDLELAVRLYGLWK